MQQIYDPQVYESPNDPRTLRVEHWSKGYKEIDEEAVLKWRPIKPTLNFQGLYNTKTIYPISDSTSGA